MIVTLTANPSLDRTVTLTAPLSPGSVHRIQGDMTQPGGKGINVAMGAQRAGHDAVAVFPADAGDPLLALVIETGIDARTSPLGGAVRTNLTVVDSTSVTTKINEPGPQLSTKNARALMDLLAASISHGDVAMLSGSLAPGLSPDAYVAFAHAAKDAGAWVGIDTSDAPLLALTSALPDVPVDFLKPNAHELGHIIGVDGDALERQASAANYGAAADAAQQLRARGVGSVLLTLGSAGALLACSDGVFAARAPHVDARSTVGAGDSATAGYLIALQDGANAPDALARAVAYGTAAVTLPGTTIPRPEQAQEFVPHITRV